MQATRLLICAHHITSFPAFFSDHYTESEVRKLHFLFNVEPRHVSPNYNWSRSTTSPPRQRLYGMCAITAGRWPPPRSTPVWLSSRKIATSDTFDICELHQSSCSVIHTSLRRQGLDSIKYLFHPRAKASIKLVVARFIWKWLTMKVLSWEFATSPPYDGGAFFSTARQLTIQKWWSAFAPIWRQQSDLLISWTKAFDKLVEALPLVLLGIRATANADIGCSAAEIFFGNPLPLPGEISVSFANASKTDPADVLLQIRCFTKRLRQTALWSTQRRGYEGARLLSPWIYYLRSGPCI